MPLVTVKETFQVHISCANIVYCQEVLGIRDNTLPLFYVKEWLVPCAYVRRNLKHAPVVVVSLGTQKVVFVVEQLVGQEEVVIKPLGDMLHGTPGMAGATFTGDGRIALILDIPGMLKHYARSAH